jgi:hypothetical protein
MQLSAVQELLFEKGVLSQEEVARKKLEIQERVSLAQEDDPLLRLLADFDGGTIQ